MHPRTLSRLSRTSLVNLVLKWLDNPGLFQKPYLTCNRDLVEAEEEDYLYAPAEDVAALRKVYQALRDDSNTTKRDLVDRIVEGDWRRGLSLDQLAMIDLQHIEENDKCLRWSALRLVPRESDSTSQEPPLKKRRTSSPDHEHFPHITPATFLHNLKTEISPLVKAHYYLHRLPPPYDLTILRIYITGAAFIKPKTTTRTHTADGTHSLYIGLPDSCPYVYIAISGPSSPRSATKNSYPLSDITSMKKVILEAIPKAFSRPQERWALESTKLTVKSLRTMCELRGKGRAAHSTGVFSSFAENVVDSTPLNPKPDNPHTTPEEIADNEELTEQQQRRHAEVAARFGSGLKNVAIDRFTVKIEDVTATAESRRSGKRKRPAGKDPEDYDTEKPSMSLSFTGTDVFAGLKMLAELGDAVLDLDRMPAWMTGEDGVSSLTV